MTLAQTIKRQRIKLGITQEAAARTIDCSLSTFVKWEREKKDGGNSPSIAMLGKLARILELDAGLLLAVAEKNA